MDKIMGENSKCDCDSVIVAGAVVGMNTPDGIQRCDLCEVFPGDLEAAYAVAQRVGGTATFLQSDEELLADVQARIEDGDLEIDFDWAEVGFTAREWTPETAREDDCVQSGTDPWVAVDGRPIDWPHVLTVLRAVRS